MLYQHLKSKHQLLVESFMLRANQEVPVLSFLDSFTLSEEEKERTHKMRLLRAKLIFEEAIETIYALGFTISYLEEGGESPQELDFEGISLAPITGTEISLIDIIDGCGDIKVVTTGTLSAFGLPDEPFQEIVDNSNLTKFREGYSIREDGKVIKSPNYVPAEPHILTMLKKLFS